MNTQAKAFTFDVSADEAKSFRDKCFHLWAPLAPFPGAVQVGAPIQVGLSKTAYFYDDLRAREDTINCARTARPESETVAFYASGKGLIQDFLATLPFDDFWAAPAARTTDARTAAFEAQIRIAYNGSPTPRGRRRNHRS